MKKQLLMVLAISASLGTFAQNRSAKTRVQLPLKEKPVSVHQLNGDPYQIPFNTNSSRGYVASTPVQNKSAQAVTEAVIGKTTYDLQTNSAILTHLINHSDGTVSAAWTMIPVGGASAARGTGYNYFDGSNWSPIPSARVEPNDRTGFVSIGVTSTGKEMAIGHSSTAGGMLLTTRAAKGTGAWTSEVAALGQQANDTWAKMAVGGANGQTVHTIWNGSGTSATQLNGQDGPILYSRSTDDGVTFPVLRTLLGPIDSTLNLGYGADCYSMDTHGDTVAIVAGEFTTDLTLLKSTDNGTTWTATTLQTFPIPFYNDAADSLPDFDGDGTSDDIEAASGDAHVMLDNNGMAHVFWSNILITDTSGADLLGYYPNGIDGGILYWNESFGANAPDTIANAQDINNDGTFTIATGSQGGGRMALYRGSITQMPTSGIDASGNLYMSYMSLCETCDTTAYGTSHKHVYVKSSMDNGATWSNPVDIDQDIDSAAQECAFACMAKHVDGNVHIVYQRDGAPGHSLLTGNTQSTTQASWNTVESDIIYAHIPVSEVLGVKSVNSTPSSFGLAQNAPNPSTGITSINFTIADKAKVTFEVTNILGKVVYAEDRGTLNAGAYNIALNTEKLSSGVYYYTLRVNDEMNTKKMMVK